MHRGEASFVPKKEEKKNNNSGRLVRVRKGNIIHSSEQSQPDKELR
jgi:hypothetical protein